MPLAFLAPMFLGGALLVGVPWLIHHIRRPEREPLKFSSLMFIPVVKKEIIERRRLQHILLLLLRMAIFLLLVLAFSRPYWNTPGGAVGEGPTRHIVLLDTSYSMTTADWEAQARAAATRVLNGVDTIDRVGIVAFSTYPTVLTPLDDPEFEDAGSVERARTALAAAEFTDGATAYLPALQMAQDLLLPDADGDETPSGPAVIHLISDFQMAGMPEDSGGWRLSQRVELDAIEIGTAIDENLAISEVGHRKMANGDVRIQGKIKNWSADGERTGIVRLFVGPDELASETVTVKSRSASQVSFRLPDSGAETLQGRLEIGADALDIDNRRYFIWNPPRKKRVLLVADERPGQRFPAAMFITSTAPQAEDGVWELSRVDREGLGDYLDDTPTLPDLMILGDLSGLDTPSVVRVMEYTRGGGSLMVMLNDALTSRALNAALMPALGLRANGFHYPDAPRQSRFDLIASIEFGHPVFVPFQGARFNDFSQVRFHNYTDLELAGPGDDEGAPRVLARFEGNGFDQGPPAVIEVEVGEGRALIWAFSPDLYWTNLPKSVKFLPLLHESMAYLTGVEQVARAWSVGERYLNLPVPAGSAGRWIVLAPGETQPAEVDPDAMRAARAAAPIRAGFYQWRSAARDDWEQIDAINIDAAESNPDRITVDEFELKLAAAPIVDERPGEDTERDKKRAALGLELRSEFWKIVMGLLLAFLLIESWYAHRLLR